jgi:hypothetical protein
MINLRLTIEDLISIIGFKEAQIYQLSKDIDAQNVVLVQLQNRVAELEQMTAQIDYRRPGLSLATES